MVLIQVKKEDIEKVFEILSDNGRFIFVESDKFRIIENSQEVLEKIKKEEIEIKVLKDDEKE